LRRSPAISGLWSGWWLNLKEPPMTEEMMKLRSLLEKAPSADVPRDMIAFVAERMMEIEAGALTGAGHGEKNTARLVHSATAIGSGTGRRGPAQSNCASLGCGECAAATGQSGVTGCWLSTKELSIP